MGVLNGYALTPLGITKNGAGVLASFERVTMKRSNIKTLEYRGFWVMLEVIPPSGIIRAVADNDLQRITSRYVGYSMSEALRNFKHEIKQHAGVSYV